VTKPAIVIVCGGGESKPGEQHGTPAAVVDGRERCPDCGSADLYTGYGLGFGPGIGVYKLCERDGCGWRWKQEDPA
jgi:uncharacterized protein (DUF983 family)